jgi:eukaryotic-like serine/threonine-protein kinase
MQKLGKFEILGKLGQGAMGVVYKARDPFIGRLVALKTITTGLAEDPALLQRFYQEARSAGALQHPNIVTIFELGKEGDTPFIAMEFLEGGSLDKILEGHPVLPLSQKLGYIVHVCRALEYAHTRKPDPVVHRDIKPGNVMVTSDGVVKVVDFGIARLGDTGKTQTGMLIGTLGYMSPQQIRGKTADARSDIWAVGIMCYEILAGQRPFLGENQAALMMNIIMQPTPSLAEAAPGTPPEVVAIVEKILKKEVEERYQTMEEVLLELEPVWKRLQQAEVSDLILNSQKLFEAKDLGKAQDVLRRAILIDTANTQAKNLLEKISAEIRRTNLIPQAEGRIQKGQELLALGQFEDASAEAEAALRLVGTFQPARDLIAQVQAAAEKDRELKLAIRTTKQRLAEGAFTDAEVQLTRVLAIDPNNPAALELQRQIREEKERRERQRRLAEILHSARSHWTDLRYQECIDLLLNAQHEFPGDAEIAKLLETARQDKAEQEKQTLLTAARNFLRSQQFEQALEKLDRVEELSPSDPTAKNMRALALEGQRQQIRENRLREELANLRAQVKAGSYVEAITQGKKLLTEYPSEPELLKLIEYAESEHAQNEKKKRLDAWCEKAGQAIKDGAFKEAIQAADAGLIEFPRNMDLMILLDKAKKRQEEKEKREVLEQRINEVRSKINRGDLTEAIDRARETLIAFGPDTDITQLLHQAEVEYGHRERKKREQESVIQQAETMLMAGKFGDATVILSHAVEDKILPDTDPRLMELKTEIIKQKTALPPHLPPPPPAPPPPSAPSSSGSPAWTAPTGDPARDYVYQQGPVLPDPVAPSDMESATSIFSATSVTGPAVQPVPPPPPPPAQVKKPKGKEAKSKPRPQQAPVQNLEASATTFDRPAPPVPNVPAPSQDAYASATVHEVAARPPAPPPVRERVESVPQAGPIPFWKQPVAMAGVGGALLVAVIAGFFLMNHGTKTQVADVATSPISSDSTSGSSSSGTASNRPSVPPSTPGNGTIASNPASKSGANPAAPRQTSPVVPTPSGATPAQSNQAAPPPAVQNPPPAATPSQPPVPTPVDYGPVVSTIQGFIGQGRWDDAESALGKLPQTQQQYYLFKGQIDAGRREDNDFNTRKNDVANAERAKNEASLKNDRDSFNALASQPGRHSAEARDLVARIDKDLNDLVASRQPVAAPPTAAPAPVVTAEDPKVAIRALFDQLSGAFANRDLKGVRQVWTAIPKNVADTLGKSFGATKSFSRNFAATNITVTGDTATVSGTYTGAVNIGSGNTPSNGTFQANLKKEGSGWTVVNLTM